MNNTHVIASGALRLMFLGQVVAVIGMALGFIPLISVIGGLATVAGAIISLVGLIKACPAHPNYGKALMMIVISVAVSILSVLLAGVALVGGSTVMLLFVAVLLPVALSVAGLLQVYFSCNATSTLVREVGNEEVAAKGDMVFKINAICYVVNIVLTVVMFFSAVLAGFGSLVTTILSIVAAVMYLIFLKQSSEVLSA